jgi:hypothetical protein
MGTEETGLPEYDNVQLDKYFLMFQRIITPSYSGSSSLHD